MSNMQFHIGFDISQKPRGRIDSNYKVLRQVLESAGFGCWEYASFPITRESLQNYDILVFPCTDFSKFSKEEIEEITTWVREDGGGLLMLSHAGGDKGRRTNLSELAQQFGMNFENDQVLDEENNFGIENMPNINIFPIQHPITQNIDSICYRAGSSITIIGMAQEIAKTGPNAKPPNSSVIVAAEVGEGKAVGVGSYEIFRDEITGGIQHPNHMQLAKNLFFWLITDKRRKLRQGGLSMEPTAKEGQPATSMTINNEDLMVNPDFSKHLVQINSVHDLFTEIKNILHDVELLRARILNIYNVASMLNSSEGQDAKEVGTAPTIQKPSHEDV
ncbi:MAG: hypothetical protein ACTSRA_16395, partial [Promethearchaeota archaeon]